MRRALAVTIALFVVVLAVALMRYAPPEPVPRDAPKDRFSAERARELQRALVGDGGSRAVGSAANAAARKVLVDELRRLGFKVETQRAFSCTYHGFCAWIENVVGTLDGRDPGAVLLSAHYDSVPAASGANDDGLGVAAVIETARALAEGDKPRHTFVVLFTDGEEAGLLGADAFAKKHPSMKTVRAAINVDARGSTGPSAMFETSHDNAWVVDRMTQALPHPVTTSLFYEVYRRMPNDTDFTVLKPGVQGVNFGNTGGVENYHTPRDTLEVSDLRTLQHHGDHALAMARAFDAELESARGNGDAVWFDVLAFTIVRWPVSWALPFALAALGFVALRAFYMRAWGVGWVVFVPALGGAVALPFLLGMVLRALGAFPAPWVAHPAPGLVALHLAAAAGAIGGSLFVARKASPQALWAGTWFGWALLGVATAATAPGMSYLFVVPAFIAGISGFSSVGPASTVPAVAASVMVMPLAVALYDALGFVVPVLACVPTVLLATTLAPLLVDLPASIAKRGPIALAAASLVAGAIALAVPSFSPAIPQRVNVAFRQDDAEGAKVFVDPSWGPAEWGKPPAPMLAALGDPSRLGRASVFPWSPPAPFATAPRLDAPAPELVVTSSTVDGGRRHVRGRLRSPRGATTLALFFPVGRTVDVQVEGIQATPRWGTVVAITAVPPEGVAIDLAAEGEDRIHVTVGDRSSGVPPGSLAETVARARRDEVSSATTTQDGDVTLLTKTFDP